jgi:hypothetical protein
MMPLYVMGDVPATRCTVHSVVLVMPLLMLDAHDAAAVAFAAACVRLFTYLHSDHVAGVMMLRCDCHQMFSFLRYSPY